MTKPEVRHCAWCGGAIPDAAGPGRPRRYCRRSHRQRAFEARRAGAERGLAAGEAVVNADAVAALLDRRYLLAAALEDGEADLRGHPTPAEVRAAYDALATAAREVVASDLEVLALGGDGDAARHPSL